jgi:protein-tyrosine phosphatase
MAGCVPSKENFDPVKFQNTYFSENCSMEVWKKSIRDYKPTLILREENGFEIYIGNKNQSLDLKTLEELNITWILNAASEHVYENGFNPTELYGDAYRYCRFAMDDVESYPIMRHFQDSNKFLKEVESGGGKVLVHCQAGRSRSCALVLAFLIECRGKSLAESAELVATQRPFVCPNLGFLRQLNQYEQQVRRREDLSRQTRLSD